MSVNGRLFLDMCLFRAVLAIQRHKWRLTPKEQEDEVRVLGAAQRGVCLESWPSYQIIGGGRGGIRMPVIDAPIDTGDRLGGRIARARRPARTSVRVRPMQGRHAERRALDVDSRLRSS